MDIMVMSPGRRVEVIRYLKQAFGKDGGRVLTLDMSRYAPALYEGDSYFVVNKDFDHLNDYIDQVIAICKKEKVQAVITLIDPELSLLAHNRQRFLDEGIQPIISDEEIVDICFDKYEFYKLLNQEVSVVKTYNEYDSVSKAIEEGDIDFPLFAKQRCGSGSAGIGKIEDVTELESYKHKKNYIYQPYVKGKEFGVDVYFDLLDGKIKSLFIKEKIAMRAGETDKAISVYREDIKELILKLEKFNFKGPIDVDVFEDSEGNIYINEINPRFGGGYPHAYNSGVNFIENIYTNLQGQSIKKNIGGYKKDVIMLKYNEAKYLNRW